jgi:hypothetical protein
VADFAIVDVGDRNASSWLLVVFMVRVRPAAAREYCEMVWAGDGGSDGGDPRFLFVAVARAVVS